MLALGDQSVKRSERLIFGAPDFPGRAEISAGLRGERCSWIHKVLCDLCLGLRSMTRSCQTTMVVRSRQFGCVSRPRRRVQNLSRFRAWEEAGILAAGKNVGARMCQSTNGVTGRQLPGASMPGASMSRRHPHPSVAPVALPPSVRIVAANRYTCWHVPGNDVNRRRYLLRTFVGHDLAPAEESPLPREGTRRALCHRSGPRRSVRGCSESHVQVDLSP